MVLYLIYLVFSLFAKLDLPFSFSQILFSIAGGLAFFLLGMDFLSNSLRNLAGTKLKNLLKSFTRTPLLAIFFGFIATTLLQSSSATTVMVVGFINTGLLSLFSAVGVIMGSNIGTTVTGQIIAFKIDNFALPLISIGILLALFANKERLKNIGYAIGGLGLLFFGLSIMKTEMLVLAESDVAKNLLSSLSSYPLLSLLASALITVLVQASAAVLGIIIALASTGQLSVEATLPLILGLNIGTTLTANIAAIRASENAKRAARIHFVFNVLGALIFLVLLKPFSYLVSFFSTGATPERMVANAHTIFNIVSTLIFVPFIAYLVKISYWLIPKSDRENELSFLDKSMLSNPEISLDQIKLGYKEMAKTCESGLLILKEYIFDQDEDKRHALLEVERKLDDYQEKIIEFIEELGKINLTEEQSEKVTRYIHIINHFEQIGDLLETLAETPYKMAVKELNFTHTQKSSLRLALKKVLKTSCLCREAINYESKNYHQKVILAFSSWKESKEEILFKNRKVVIMKSLGIERMNYFVDLVLPLNEIAKKFTNIAWEACGGDNISLEREM